MRTRTFVILVVAAAVIWLVVLAAIGPAPLRFRGDQPPVITTTTARR